MFWICCWYWDTGMRPDTDPRVWAVVYTDW